MQRQLLWTIWEKFTDIFCGAGAVTIPSKRQLLCHVSSKQEGRECHRSEKTREGWNCRFQKHPARKVGTRSRECRPKVPHRFAFPGARNPRICSIWQFGKIIPAIFPGLSRNFPPERPSGSQKQPQPSRVF